MRFEEQLVRTAPDVRLRTLSWAPDDSPRAPAFLLVHGLASNAWMWSLVAERLAAAGHRAVAVDQRGHGASQRDPEGTYDLARLTDDLLAVAAALDLRRPVVAGQSWGGNVAVALGRRAPEAVLGIAGVDGGVIDLQAAFPDWEACREALRPPALAGTPRVDLERVLRQRHPGWCDAAVRAQLAGHTVRPDGTVAPHLPLEDHLAILRGLWESPPDRALDGFRVPLLLLPVAEPGDDARTAWKRSAVATAERRVDDLRVRWFADHDHDVHVDAPEEVARELLASARAWSGREMPA